MVEDVVDVKEVAFRLFQQLIHTLVPYCSFQKRTVKVKANTAKVLDNAYGIVVNKVLDAYDILADGVLGKCVTKQRRSAAIHCIAAMTRAHQQRVSTTKAVATSYLSPTFAILSF